MSNYDPSKPGLFYDEVKATYRPAFEEAIAALVKAAVVIGGERHLEYIADVSDEDAGALLDAFTYRKRLADALMEKAEANDKGGNAKDDDDWAAETTAALQSIAELLVTKSERDFCAENPGSVLGGVGPFFARKV